MRFCSMFVFALLVCCCLEHGNGAEDMPLMAPGGFYTRGTHIHDAKGKKHIFRGVNGRIMQVTSCPEAMYRVEIHLHCFF
jgi:hypothetical protein